MVAEIALALMLSVGAGLLIRSLVRLQHVDTGFESAQPADIPALAARRPLQGRECRAGIFYDRLLERLQAVPGVQHAATAVSLPPDQVTVTDNFTAEGQHYAVGDPRRSGR